MKPCILWKLGHEMTLRLRSAGNTDARQGEQRVGQEREAAFRIRKAAKRLLFEAAEEYLREQGAEAMFKLKSQVEQVTCPLHCLPTALAPVVR